MRKRLEVFARNPHTWVFAGLFLIMLLPAQALAWDVELRLNCEYERFLTDREGEHESGPVSGSFSAIVHMKQDKTGTFALIEATTIGCFDYVGSFTDLVVTGDCERTVAGLGTDKATLTFNRLSGAFDHSIVIGKSFNLYSGHCVPAKKLF
jgi:hypothetical protein